VATREQLQQAGLLQHLPALMTHAAQELAAVTAKFGATGLGSSSSSYGGSSVGGSSGGGGSSSSSSSSRASRVGPGCNAASNAGQARIVLFSPAASSEQRNTEAVWVNTFNVLWIYDAMLYFASSMAGMAACLPAAQAALELILAVFEAFPTLQQQLQRHAQQQQQQHLLLQRDEWQANLAGMIQLVHHSFLDISTKIRRVGEHLNTATGQGSSAAATARTLDEVLCSPQLHRCLTLMTSVTAVAMMNSSSSNGASSSSSSSR
jgi:hypothetical protein